jgi:heme-degrading monooxygenase HmoA
MTHVLVVFLILAQHQWIRPDPKVAFVEPNSKELCAQAVAIADRDQADTEDAANVDVRRAKVDPDTPAADTAQVKQRDAKPKPALPVIARLWRGRVPTSRAEEYAKYLYESGILKIRAIPANLGAQMFRRTEGDVTEFMVISYWPSRESIKAFAGEDIERVHPLPRDNEFLIDPDPFVRHYEVSAQEWAAGK